MIANAFKAGLHRIALVTDPFVSHQPTAEAERQRRRNS
jgi:hypothetical protein